MTPFWYLKRHFSKIWPILAYFSLASLFASMARACAPAYSKWRERVPLSEYKLILSLYQFLNQFRAKNDNMGHLGTYLQNLKANGQNPSRRNFCHIAEISFFPYPESKSKNIMHSSFSHMWPTSWRSLMAPPRRSSNTSNYHLSIWHDMCLMGIVQKLFLGTRTPR